VLKNTAIGGQPVETLISFRLLNRTLVAVMLTLLSVCATAWQFWQYERTTLTSPEKVDEDELNATAGAVGCIGIGLMVIAADLFAPAKLNLPILLLVPLYLVSWQKSRRTLWGTAGLLIAMTWLGYFLSAIPAEPAVAGYLMINRLIVSAAILGAAGILSWRINRQNRLGRESRGNTV
jgi:hypothetical protein